ncbi:hypothetical protein [Enterococcus dongliensis]|nr:hypothetical protein [Enterococcus dongliensis]
MFISDQPLSHTNQETVVKKVIYFSLTFTLRQGVSCFCQGAIELLNTISK